MANSVNAEESTSREILKTIPIAPVQQRSGSKNQAEYCPDNTCEVIFVGKKVANHQFDDLVLIYFYYFSKYNYLASWRNNEIIKLRVKNRLDSLAQASCLSQEGKDRARCVLMSHVIGNQLTFDFVRFDERRRIVQTLTAREALE